MHSCLMFVSHFFAGLSLVVVVLGRFFSFGRQKKVVASRARQVVVLHSNNCMRICLGGLKTGRHRRVVVL